MSLRTLAISTLIASALLLLAAPASAHVDVLASQPSEGQIMATPPSKFTLRLTGEIDSSAATATVFDASGTSVGTPPRITEGLADRISFDGDPLNLVAGDYSVEFRAIAADGHPLIYQVQFTVGSPQDSPAMGTDTDDHHDSAAPGLKHQSGVTAVGLAHASEAISRILFTLGASLALGALAWAWAFNTHTGANRRRKD
jgi:copper resistance protein C